MGRPKTKPTTSPTKDSDFTEFLKAESGKENHRRKVWDELSQEAREEIEEVLRLNDEENAGIRVESMLKRLHEVHGWKHSQTSLVRYVKECLGRKNWREA